MIVSPSLAVPPIRAVPGAVAGMLQPVAAAVQPGDVAPSIDAGMTEPAAMVAQGPHEALRSVKLRYDWSRRQQVGRGTYGMVFLVPRKGTRSLVAIKEVETSDPDDRSYEREFSYMNQLRHPNLVECLATYLFPASSRGYIVMRAADHDIERFLNIRADRVHVRLASCMLMDISDGLRYLSEMMVVHRDLKPGNVLMRLGDDGHITCCICDLGSATGPSAVAGQVAFLSEGADFAESCVATSPAQTVGYRAPEAVIAQTYAHGPSAYPMDVFSIGCIAFRLFYGKHVHENPGTREAQLESYARILGPGDADVPWVWSSVWVAADMPADNRVEALIASHPASVREYVLGCMAWHPTRRWAFWCSEGKTLLLGIHCTYEDPSIAAGQVPPDPSVKLEEKIVDVAHSAETQMICGPTAQDSQPVSSVDPGSTPQGQPPPPAAVRTGCDWLFISKRRSRRAVLGSTVCACSGNCYQPGHRYAARWNNGRGCASHELLVGGSWCVLCSCVVVHCCKPRVRGMYCLGHAAWAASASPSIRASIAAARHESHMYLIPPDILDFVCSWSLLKENLVLAILVAWIKVPHIRRRFTSHLMRRVHDRACELGTLAPPQGSAALALVNHHDVASALLFCISVDTERTELELAEQRALSRDGGARTLGLVAVASALGIVTPSRDKVPSIDAGRTRKRQKTHGALQLYPLGLDGRPYVVVQQWDLVDETCQLMSKVDSSSIVAELEEGTCDGVLRFVERLDVVIGEVGIILGTLKRNTYTREHITRSLLVAGLASSQGKIDWSELPVSFLQQTGPDERSHLAHFSHCAHIQEASELVFGRGDFGIFLGMFSCLWGEAIRKHGEERTVEIASSSEFQEVARRMCSTQGFPPHPCAVMEVLEPLHAQVQA